MTKGWKYSERTGQFTEVPTDGIPSTLDQDHRIWQLSTRARLSEGAFGKARTMLPLAGHQVDIWYIGYIWNPEKSGKV